MATVSAAGEALNTGTGWLVAGCVLLALVLLAPVPDRRLQALRPGPSQPGSAPAWWRQVSGRPRHGPRRGPRLTEDVAAAAGELAVLLRSGMPAAMAWRHVPPGDAHPALVAAAASARDAAEQGADVAAALLEAAAGARGDPGRAALHGLAVTWHVAQHAGAPVADLLARYADYLRAEVDAAAEVEGALAAPRATVRVLVALPPAGLALGAALGADPVGVLLGTAAGRVSAVAGAGFAVTGWWWTRRLLSAARAVPG